MVNQKKLNTTLQFHDYSLKPLEERDLDKVFIWRNSDRIRVNMYHDHLITKEEHQAWFQRMITSDEARYLVFEYRGNPVGIVNFTKIDMKNGKSDWGFYIGEENMPKGTGFLMGNMGLIYAFEVLSTRKLCGEVFAFNTPSRNFHTKLGFQLEGKLNKHMLKNGKYEDVMLFGLLKEDWLKSEKMPERDECVIV